MSKVGYVGYGRWLAIESEEWIRVGTEKVNERMVLHGAEKLGREASSACLV